MNNEDVVCFGAVVEEVGSNEGGGLCGHGSLLGCVQVGTLYRRVWVRLRQFLGEENGECA